VTRKPHSSTDAIAGVETYLAKVPETQRVALEHLRATIRAAAPDAEEALIYGVPGFRQDGPLVCYAAHKSHCGFYPMSPALLDSLAAELGALRKSEGTIKFTPEKPLPYDLVRRIVVMRLGENAAKRRSR
jgi:uncharacterized protein YdhG (YjbR/CyaY superfamily)